ncbi:MaoC family dehydratase N-terminal domain-containing protein [Sphingomonas sp. CGMCC 1.13654]|uniref:MaoC family dehydratase N-terminal domain-containing protein n=1 Tax=Sphingomonas chungangi TaxID=2683589 RepID=A0A838L383_9SPHN|nr:MaoC family dehydratase N-terminal domain-containing protein [Sphingomonas chungangi]MBA2933527.1 MaoC family dehydratase N-terminal domain-containing protein [Sphingomonas chungangi]MVW54860.1 MaoC family dehydratase [Sphingomonas chungangi]
MIDRDRHLGVDSEPRTIEIERGFLKFFAKATGETDPIYFDEAAARTAGHPDLPVPPTYFFSISINPRPRRGDIFDEDEGLGIPMSRVLHGEQGFTYHRTVHAGDRLTLRQTTRDIVAKKGGALEFVTHETLFENAAGQLCAEMRVVTVVRNG